MTSMYRPDQVQVVKKTPDRLLVKRGATEAPEQGAMEVDHSSWLMQFRTASSPNPIDVGKGHADAPERRATPRRRRRK